MSSLVFGHHRRTWPNTDPILTIDSMWDTTRTDYRRLGIRSDCLRIRCRLRLRASIRDGKVRTRCRTLPSKVATPSTPTNEDIPRCYRFQFLPVGRGILAFPRFRSCIRALFACCRARMTPSTWSTESTWSISGKPVRYMLLPGWEDRRSQTWIPRKRGLWSSCQRRNFVSMSSIRTIGT